MRWFKHMTDSLDDPFMQDVLDEFSYFGYFAWFGLIEIIAKENKNEVTGKLSINPVYLRRKLRASAKKLEEFFQYCQAKGKLSCNFSENIWNFDFPKIAEIKDNYTKDLQASGKKLAPYKEREGEKEVEQRKKKKKQASTANMPEDEWIAMLQANPAYQGIDIPKLKAKMEAWCVTNGKQPTRKRLLNWLNREDKPLRAEQTQGAPNGSPKGHTQIARTQAGGIRGDASIYNSAVVRFDEGEGGDKGGQEQEGQ